MDHIKWDSDACDEYSAELKISYCRLADEIQSLSDARKHMQAFYAESSDEALGKILLLLGKYIVRLEETNERIRKLKSAVDEANSAFAKAEAHIGNMGAEVLYTAIKSPAQYGEKSPLVSVVRSRFESNAVHPQWLYARAEKHLDE